MSNNAKAQIDKINRLYKQQGNLYHNLAVRFGLSDTAFWVLYALCSSKGPVTQYDLANGWFFPKQTVNSAITGLEKTGILSLMPLAGTSKSKNVLLTGAGSKFCAGTLMPVLNAERRAILRFTKEEREAFLLFMEKQLVFLKEETERILEQ